MFLPKLAVLPVGLRAAVMLCLAAVSLGLAGDGLAEILSRRWSALGEERQAELRDRWTRFQNLTEKEQQDLLECHEVLREAMESVLSSLAESDRAEIESLDVVARRRALKPLLKQWLKSEERRVTAPLEGDPTFMEGGELQIGALQEAARMRAAKKLLVLEKQGVLEPGVAEQLFDLPPWKLKKALRSIRKKALFDRPPKWFRSLSSEAREGLKGLPPDVFAMKLRELRGSAGRPSMDSVLSQLIGPEDADKQTLGRFLRQLSAHPGTARAAMEDQLTPEQLAELSGLHGKDRKLNGMRLLRENAAEALADRGVSEEDAAGIFRQLNGLPMKARLPYLIRLIHGKPVEPGNGGRRGGRGGAGWRGKNRSRSG